MRSLNTPIQVPNIAKWRVTSCVPYLDLAVPKSVVTVQFLGTGNVVYRTVGLDLTNAATNTGVKANPASSGYTDKLSLTNVTAAGVHTAIQAANTSAGSRSAQLQAIEAALLSTGIVDASLNGT